MPGKWSPLTPTPLGRPSSRRLNPDIFNAHDLAICMPGNTRWPFSSGTISARLETVIRHPSTSHPSPPLRFQQQQTAAKL